MAVNLPSHFQAYRVSAAVTAIETKRPSGGWTSGSALAGLALITGAVCLTLRPHDHPSADPHAHSMGVIPAVLLALGVALTLATAARQGRWRHALGFGLVALLTVFTVEAALHSVHHLGDADADASCVVSGATAHLSGITASSTDLGAPALTPERAGDRASTWPVSLQSIRPREGRAPPVPVPA